MPQLDGIDCSSNQGHGLENGGYDEAIAAGAWFAFEKATEGGGYRNPYFPHRRQLIAAKFPMGGTYHWVSPGVPVARQVANFVGYVGSLGREGIQIDAEQAGITDDEVVGVTRGIYDYYGARVLLYGNLGLIARIQNRLPPDVKFWLPWYDDSWSFIAGKLYAAGVSESDVVVWQWGGGRQGVFLPSLGSRVDSNFVRDPATFRRICGLPDQPHGGIPNEEDDMPLNDDDKAWIEAHVHDQAFAAVIQVLRSTEAARIIWQQSRPDAPYPSEAPQ